MSNNYGNCLLIYGGGLCDSANYVMRKEADLLKSTELFDKVNLGFYSFESMLNPSFIEEWSSSLKAKAEKRFGGYFGTCRGIQLTEEEKAVKAIKNLKEKDIRYVFVCGGDGSARNCAEIADSFAKEGILVNFILPCTVDGINGSKSVGIRAATRVSCKIIEQLTSTSLNTRSDCKAPGLIIETQGRNRDDILANVIKEIINGNVSFDYAPYIAAIPANYTFSVENLLQSVNSPDNRQTPYLILLSEGAPVGTKDLEGLFRRKFRSFKIAHLTQMNGMTDEVEKNEIDSMLTASFVPMQTAIYRGEPFSLAYNSDKVTIEDIGYYKRHNPKENQLPILSKELEDILLSFVID